MSGDVLVNGSPYIFLDYIHVENNSMSINGCSKVQTGGSHTIYYSYVV